MTQKKKIPIKKLPRNNKIAEGIGSTLMMLLYLGFGIIFYTLTVLGLILIISAFFNPSSFLALMSFGVGSVAVALGINTGVTRLTTGKWALHLPDTWIA